MDNDKSIFEKITDTVKDIANIASDAASQALKAEEPPLKRSDQQAVAFMPLAGDGLVSDPMMVPPVAAMPARRKKRGAPKPAVKKAAKTAARKVAKTSASKKKSKKAIKKAVTKSAKKGAKKAGKKVAKKKAMKKRQRA